MTSLTSSLFVKNFKSLRFAFFIYVIILGNVNHLKTTEKKKKKFAPHLTYKTYFVIDLDMNHSL